MMDKDCIERLLTRPATTPSHQKNVTHNQHPDQETFEPVLATRNKDSNTINCKDVISDIGKRLPISFEYTTKKLLTVVPISE